MFMDYIESDRQRIAGRRLMLFQFFLRKLLSPTPPPIFIFLVYKAIYKILSTIRCLEIPNSCKIGYGLYIGHAYCITINPMAKLGNNVNIHRGVLIGQENRGARKGYPTIGNNVWIGINASIVGNVTIGDDVLIAPNTYVNCDVPSHSIVFGNPCIIRYKENATYGYVQNPVSVHL